MTDAKTNNALKHFTDEIFKLYAPSLVQAYQSKKAGRSRTESKYEVLLVDVFRRFYEIHLSLERLQEFKKMISKRPPRSWHVSNLTFLKIVTEAYLNESFVFRERMLSFTKFIERKLGKAEFKNCSMAGAKEEITKFFKKLSEIRSSHVHEKRYFRQEFSDADPYELIASTRIEGDPEREMWIEAADQRFKKAQQSIKSSLYSDLPKLENFLNWYFGLANDVVLEHLLKPQKTLTTP